MSQGSWKSGDIREKSWDIVGKMMGQWFGGQKSVSHQFASLLTIVWPLINSITNWSTFRLFGTGILRSRHLPKHFPFQLHLPIKCIVKISIVELWQLVDVHRFPRPGSLCISFPQVEQQKFCGTVVLLLSVSCRLTSWMRCACQKDFHWSIKMAPIDRYPFL